MAVDRARDFRSIELRDYTKERELTGRVTRLFYQSDKFSTGRLDTTEGPVIDRECSFVIQGRVDESATITLHGVWTKHPKYGWQFRAESYSYPMPGDSSAGGVCAGLASYLSQDKDFAGIGPAKAAALAEAFPTLEAFEQALGDPARIAEIAKITIPQAEELAAVWTARAALNSISTWLAEYGLTAHQIKRIAEQYGQSARGILAANPYCLMHDLDGFGFLRTDQIALKMGVSKEHPYRLRACILHTLDETANGDGHTYIERRALVDTTLKNLYLDSLQARSIIKRAIDEMCEASDGPLVCVTHDGADYIALRWLHAQEMALLEWFRRSHTLPVTLPESVCADSLLATHGAGLNAEQRAAALEALTSRVSIITGGAGTGKSHTIKTIRNIYRSLDMTVGICAPTGKAARRLANDEMSEARTIHRLLEYSPEKGGFTYDRDNPLPYDVVIVDEVSMCAVPLLYSLFSAVRLTQTVVVLVGDANQLPPIGPGNVLRDCVEHAILPTTRLITCHRNAGKLKENCAAILDGKLVRQPARDANAEDRFQWFVVGDREDPEQVISLIRLLMESQFEEWRFDTITECQIIAPQRKGAIGVNRLNLECQRIWQQKRYSRTLPEISNPDKRATLYPGDKIMQTKNDYKLDQAHGGVMNGTQGVIVDITLPPGSDHQVYRIQWEDRAHTVDVEVNSDQADNITLAYVCTVHKVQGSQYQCVVSVVHRQHAYMLSRNLLYTACTRARTSSIIIGESVGLRRAVHTITSMTRNTWMALLHRTSTTPQAGGPQDGETEATA